MHIGGASTERKGAAIMHIQVTRAHTDNREPGFYSGITL